MTDRTPTTTTNLDRYGNDALPWSRPHDLFANQTPGPEMAFYLSTTRPDGRPHAVGIGPLWFDGDLYFTSNPETRKSRNLAANPNCTITGRLEGLDISLEGVATRVTDPAILEQVAARYRAGRLARRGRGRRLHRAIQRPQRRSATVAPLPPHLPHRDRRRHRRAPRRNPLALRGLMRRGTKGGLRA